MFFLNWFSLQVGQVFGLVYYEAVWALLYVQMRYNIIHVALQHWIDLNQTGADGLGAMKAVGKDLAFTTDIC